MDHILSHIERWDYVNSELRVFLIENNALEVFEYLLDSIWWNYKKFHYYLKFLDAFVFTNQSVPDNVIRILMYLFYHTDKILEENIHFQNFLDVSTLDTFLSPQFLAEITQFDFNEMSQFSKLKLLRAFFSNYENFVILGKYKQFFRELLKHIIATDFSKLTQFNFSLYKLTIQFEFSLGESLQILYFGEKRWIFINIFTVLEINLLQTKLQQYSFWQEIDWLEKEIIYDLLYKTYKKIDYMKIQNTAFSKSYFVYFLLLLSQKKYFSDILDSDFLEYYLQEFHDSNDLWVYLWEVFSFSNMLDFIIKNNVDFLKSPDFIRFVFSIVFTENRYKSRFFDLWSGSSQSLVYHRKNIINCLPIQQLSVISLYSDCMAFLLQQLSTNDCMYDFYRVISCIWELNLSAYKLNALYDSIKQSPSFLSLSYKQMEYIILFYTKLNESPDIWFLDFILQLSQKSSKFAYLVGKNKREIYKSILPKSHIHRIKEAIFYSRLLPFKIYHYWKYVNS